MLLRDLENKKIVILGLGEEGIDNYLALRKLFPDKVLGMADQNKFSIFNFQFSKLLKNDKNLKLHLGEGYLNAIGEYDVIIKTPGIPANTLKPFLKEGSLVTTQTEIFFANFSGKIIGVTGTKGKGTTSALIYSILKTAGFKVKLVGNIGQFFKFVSRSFELLFELSRISKS
ncbi:MAG: Mur ligase family protein [Candidatus Gribaldobacteria bacterium]|nr:Mur ligase family protein [Candidatus Gribaldobacteria bacterium]